MSADRDREVRFECLRCGEVSPVERAQTPPPRCARCGSGTGVLGDIGQGSAASRRRRGYGTRSNEAGGQIQFECLRCGELTLIRVEPVRPRCTHCGSRDGVVVENDA